jgi:hypothetical protein
LLEDERNLGAGERRCILEGRQNNFPTARFPRQCPFVLVGERLRKRVKRWEVKAVKGYEEESVASRGNKLSRGCVVYDPNFDN